MNAGVVTLAVPCRTDEPALGRTLAAAWSSWRAAPQGSVRQLETLVCLNGRAPVERTLDQLLAFGRAHGLTTADIDLDAAPFPGVAGATTATLIALRTRREGKAMAWNALRRRARGAVAIFMDADVSFASDAFGLLLQALDEHPEAVLASAKTTCDARPTAFERVMAAPYGIDFPNLSAQLYAARMDALPAEMPDDLLEPERWLELTVGADRVVRAPGARVVVRLPSTLRDFFRQRIRIEMAKVQLAVEHGHLAGRGAAQPGLGAALRGLRATDVLRLGVYLALRESAHVVARRRYAQGRTAGIWAQAGSTKRWETP